MYKLIILLMSINLMACSTEKLYHIAIDYERGKSNLVVKYQTFDFGKIAYLENTAKSDITTVLLHGFGAEKDIWNRFIAELDENTHIIALDLPGHGESVADKNLNYAISEQSTILNAFLKTKNIKKIHLVGNSMGGAIAIHYSGQYPNNVKTLTLIDAMGTQNTKQELSSMITKSGRNPLILDECSEQQFIELINTGMEKPPYIPGIFMDYLVSIKCAKAEIEKIVFNAILQEADLTKTYTAIKIPTLILWGKKDGIFSVDNAKLFHNGISGSQLVLFDDIGHVPLLEAPEKTAKAFNAFIKNMLLTKYN